MFNSEWKLGRDLISSDSLLDGITFNDVILALHTESTVNEFTARRVLREILEIRMQDMNYLFENNVDQIVELAMKGRS